MAALLAAALLYEPRVTFNQGLVIPDDIFASDLMNDRYPVRVELGRALRAGYLPLWTRLIYCGFPLQANPESGITYPPNLLLFGLLPPALALNGSILLKYFLSALFLYLYLRRLELGRGPAVFGGIAFAWSGFFVSHVRHLNMHDAGIWIPLLLYLLERYRGDRQWRWLLWGAAAFGLQALAGHPQISYYTGLLLAAYFLWLEAPGLRCPWRIAGAAARLGVFLGLGTALGMVQLLPTLELAQWSERAGGVTYEFANRYQYYLPNLLTFFYPYIHGDPGQATYREKGIFWEDYGYVGVLPLAAAAWALATGLRRDPHVRFHAVAGALALALMLGDQAGLYRLAYRFLPGMDYFRFANRFILLVDLALCVLAAQGLHRALEGRRAWLPALAVLVLVADLFTLQRRQNPVVDRRQWESLPPTARVLRSDPQGGRALPLSGVQTHLAAYRDARGWQGDLSPYVRQRDALQPSSNMLWGIATANGYMNLVPRHVVDLWGNEKTRGAVERSIGTGPDGLPQIGDAFVRSASAYAVRYLVSVWPLPHPDLSLVAAAGDHAVYGNRAARPRCYLARQAALVRPEREAELVESVARRGLDPERLLIHAEGPLPVSAPAGAAAETGTARIRRDEDHRVEIECHLERDGWLFLADTYYPGWQGWVDGRRTEIYRANLAGRAVHLEAGPHRVVFEYRPDAFYRGLWVSAAALLAIGGGLLWCRRQARPRPALPGAAG